MKPLVLFIVIILFLNSAAFAQVLIGDSKNHVKTLMRFSAGKYDKTSTKIETDSSYIYLIRGDVKPADSYFLFNKKGNCYFEKWTFDCDTCYNKWVNDILNKGRYKWRLTGQNQYLSKISKQLKLNTDLSKLSFTITQFYMSEPDYLLLYNNTGSSK